MFGIPLSGADICGYYGDADDELCGRWMQLGAFYPFSRNHYHHDAKEPYRFPEQIMNASRTAVQQKYNLLRYYYTTFYEVHTNVRLC